MNDWKEFFEKYGERYLDQETFATYGEGWTPKYEQMYQAFKSRLEAESLSKPSQKEDK